jgi:hypothetical protein
MVIPASADPTSAPFKPEPLDGEIKSFEVRWRKNPDSLLPVSSQKDAFS